MDLVQCIKFLDIVFSFAMALVLESAQKMYEIARSFVGRKSQELLPTGLEFDADGYLIEPLPKAVQCINGAVQTLVCLHITGLGLKV